MKVIRDLPKRDFSELNAAQNYLFDKMPVIGSSLLFIPVIAQMEMPALPRLMNNKAERAALETTWLTRIKSFIHTFEQAIEQERRKVFNPVKCYTLTDPLPGEYIDQSPISYCEFKQLCV